LDFVGEGRLEMILNCEQTHVEHLEDFGGSLAPDELV
jgi:hypothetical protein